MTSKQFKNKMNKVKLDIFEEKTRFTCYAIVKHLGSMYKLYQKRILPSKDYVAPLHGLGLTESEKLQVRLYLLELFENLVLTDYIKE
jgi:hypothetical protein